VVLGDVVDSREIDDREPFQRTLAETLDAVNEEFDDSLQAPFAVLKGVDEIGGVLRTVPPLVEIQRRLARAVHPQQMRIAAVLGEVDVNEGAGDVSVMDGEAFARADALLAELESDDFTFRLEGDESVLDDLLSDEINLLDMLRAEWTERQLEIVTRYDALDSQKAVAESLDISPQAVSKALSRTKGKKVLTIEERLAEAVQLYPSLRTD
jgi:predicted DNA-binding protein YlxM (UPF0122 family)